MTAASLHERLGVHRVLEPPGGLPQPAWRLDPRPPTQDSEVVVAVERISLDAWSFRDLWGEGFEERLLALVRERGKLHNPTTDSGGTLVGTVAEIGPEAAADRGLTVGDRVVVLTSCSAIPLALERVLGLHPDAAQVEVDGRAVVPLAFPLARAPDDLDLRLIVAAADTAGAPGLVHDLAEPGGRVAVLGANGTAGLLACAAAQDLGAQRVVGIDLQTDAVDRAGVADTIRADATDALAVLAALDGFEADVVAHAAAAEGCEAAAVASVAAEGTIVLFSLATSFQRCVNIADVFGKRPRMLVANALRLHHAGLAYELLRRYPAVREEIARR